MFADGGSSSIKDNMNVWASLNLFALPTHFNNINALLPASPPPPPAKIKRGDLLHVFSRQQF